MSPQNTNTIFKMSVFHVIMNLGSNLNPSNSKLGVYNENVTQYINTNSNSYMFFLNFPFSS